MVRSAPEHSEGKPRTTHIGSLWLCVVRGSNALTLIFAPHHEGELRFTPFNHRQKKLLKSYNYFHFIPKSGYAQKLIFH